MKLLIASLLLPVLHHLVVAATKYAAYPFIKRGPKSAEIAWRILVFTLTPALFYSAAYGLALFGLETTDLSIPSVGFYVFLAIMSVQYYFVYCATWVGIVKEPFDTSSRDHAERLKKRLEELGIHPHE